MCTGNIWDFDVSLFSWRGLALETFVSVGTVCSLTYLIIMLFALSL